MKLYHNFAKLLYDVRKDAGLSHEDLTSHIGVPNVRSVSRWENGQNPNDEHFEAIVRTLHIPVLCASLALRGVPFYFDVGSRRMSFSDTPAKLSMELSNLEPWAGITFSHVNQEHHAKTIGAYDRRIYPTPDPVPTTLVMRAAQTAIPFSQIALDSLGIHVGHLVIFPMRMGTLLALRDRQLSEREAIEKDYAQVSDEDSVLYVYTIYGLTSDIVSYMVKAVIEYLRNAGHHAIQVAAYAVTRDGLDMARKLNLQTLATHPAEAEKLCTNEVPTLYCGRLAL